MRRARSSWGAGGWRLLIGLACLLATVRGVEGTEGKEPSDAAPRALVTFRPESVVRGGDIRLGEVADIQGRDAAFVARLREVEVGRAPLPGLSRTLDLVYLKMRLRLERIDPAGLVLDAPPAISVTTASQPVSGAALVAAAREHVLEARRVEGKALTVTATAFPPDLLLPAGRLELKVRTRPGGDLASATSVAVEAWVDGVLVRSVGLSLKVAAVSEVLVAARPIPRHAILGAEDIHLERRELSGGQEPLQDPTGVLGRWAVRPIATGELIQSTLLELPSLVRRGDVVLLTIEAPGLRAVTKGEAREEGRLGQVIRVRNLSSGREVYGQVEGERAVRVPF